MVLAEWQIVNAAAHKALRLAVMVRRMAKEAGIDGDRLASLESEFRRACEITQKGILEAE